MISDWQPMRVLTMSCMVAEGVANVPECSPNLDLIDQSRVERAAYRASAELNVSPIRVAAEWWRHFAVSPTLFQRQRCKCFRQRTRFRER